METKSCSLHHIRPYLSSIESPSFLWVGKMELLPATDCLSAGWHIGVSQTGVGAVPDTEITTLGASAQLISNLGLDINKKIINKQTNRLFVPGWTGQSHYPSWVLSGGSRCCSERQQRAGAATGGFLFCPTLFWLYYTCNRSEGRGAQCGLAFQPGSSLLYSVQCTQLWQ